MQWSFEWDANKNSSNLQKHGISFEDVRPVFDDPFAMTLTDRFVDGEERFRTIGSAADGTVMVIHTMRGATCPKTPSSSESFRPLRNAEREKEL